MEYPAQLCDGLVGRHNSPLVDQHRIGGRAQCCHLSHDNVIVVRVHTIYRLCVPETAARRGTPASSVVVGEIWRGGEFWRVGVSLPDVSVCIFPAVNKCDSRNNELVGGDVCRSRWIGVALLLGQGQTSFHSTRGLGQQGREVTFKAGSCISWLDIIGYAFMYFDDLMM